METTLINSKKLVPDKGCNIKSTWKSNMISLVFLFFLCFFNITSTFAQVEPNLLGNAAGWDKSNVELFAKHSFETDKFGSGVVDDQFTTGSKDFFFAGCAANNCLTWADGQTKAKGDIEHAATILINNKMYFAGDRSTTNGDAQVGFWFFKNGTGPIANGTFAPPHVDGDILIIANFTNGGTTAEIELYQWDADGVDPNIVPNTDGHLRQLNLPPGSAAGRVNTSEIPRREGWGNGVFEENQFFEGYVDFNGIQGIDLCIKSFLLETRASQEVTASLDDFVGGTFSGTPLPPTGSASVCSGFSTDVTASGCANGTIKWYSAETGGTLLFTGVTYTTPVLTQTTDYWLTCTVDGCEGERGKVTVTVKPNPVPTAQDLTECEEIVDGVQTGKAHFDLDDAVTDADGGTISFHISQADANSGANPIIAPAKDNYEAADGAIIYIRSVKADCAGTASFKLNVKDRPDIVKQDLTECEEIVDGVQTGKAHFDLDDAVTDADGGTISFHLSQADANSGANPIIAPTKDNYEAADGAIIYIRSVKADCAGTASFKLNVKDRADVATKDLEACEEYEIIEGVINPLGYAYFDLDNGLTDADAGTVTFHTSQANANSGANPIADADKDHYQILVGEITIWVRSVKGDCVGTGSFKIKVNPLPIPSCPDNFTAGVLCGVENEVAQTDANQKFKAWLALGPQSSVDYLVTASFEYFDYDPNTAIDATPPVNGDAPLILAFTDPTILETSVTITWTFENRTTHCINSCSAKYTIVYACTVGCNTEFENVLCNGGDSGSITANATGGMPNYTIYLFNDPIDFNDAQWFNKYLAFKADLAEGEDFKFMNLKAGNYLIIAADAVTTLESRDWIPCKVTIDEPDTPLDVSITDHADASCGGSDGTITATFSGGTPIVENNINKYYLQLDVAQFDINTALKVASPYTFQNLAKGDHHVYVFDANYATSPQDGCMDDAPATIGEEPCDNALCTYTQGAYGNKGGKYCDGNNGGIITSQLIYNAINNAPNDEIIVGKLGHSVRLTLSPINSVQCVIDKMPGGGPAKVLAAGDVNICSFSDLKNGRINNVLLSQTIALSLNINIKGTNELANFALQAGTLATAKVDGGCGSDSAKVRVCAHCENGVCVGTVNEYTYRSFSAAVINAINGTKNVAGLLDLANRALAGENVGVSLSEIAGAVGSVNEVFDECRISVGWDQTKCPACPDCTQQFARSADTSDMTLTNSLVKAYPNPFKDHLTFELKADVSANASLQVFNILGQRVSDVFSGYLEAGTVRNVDFNTPYNMNETMLIYVYRLGDHTYTGRLIVKP